MGRALRWLGYGLGGLVATAGLAAGYVRFAYPIIPKHDDTKVVATDETLARGTYLAEHVAVCVDCHSERDWSRFTAPAIPSTLGQGGERFGHEMGFPGEIIAPNITPYALGKWTDGELIQAITSGVTPDGRALFPLMNYGAFSKLCRSDVEALVAYVRSLAPIKHDTEASQLDFPFGLIVRAMPKQAELSDACPDRKDAKKYGEYLVTTGGCIDCHTQHDGPSMNLDLAFAGGVEFQLPGGTVKSKNITPDSSGIGGWSREAFIARFAAYRDPESLYKLDKGDKTTVMPWAQFAGMTDEDLGAIYDFLRTVKPVKTSDPQLAQR